MRIWKALLAPIMPLMASIFAAILPLGALAAKPVTDCPMARDTLGVEAPLIDVLLHPQGAVTMDRIAPGLMVGFTRNFGGGDLPPGFSAILTPGALLESLEDGAELAGPLDQTLRSLPIDEAFVFARCARYDNDRPDLPAVDGRPAILVFEKITGFRDDPSVMAAQARLRAIGEDHGWQMVFTDKGGVMNAADLTHFAAVVWNNVSGDALTVPQRAAFRSYIEQGGGYIGIHGAAGDPRFFWDWYVDTLVGARFIGHPADPQFQTARVSLTDHRSGIAQGLPSQWPMLEEWYSFDRDPVDGGAVAIATIDESDYVPVGHGGLDITMGHHPVAWRKYIGDGRAFYSAIGHRPENYDDPNFVVLLANAIQWAAGGAESPPEHTPDRDGDN